MEEIKDLSVIEKAGNYIAKSGLFGVKTPEQAIEMIISKIEDGLQ